MNELNLQRAIELLDGLMPSLRQSDHWPNIVERRHEVYRRYRPVMAAAGTESFSIDEFATFLDFKHNHHWTNMQRSRGHMTADPEALSAAIAVLLDESRPLRDRIDESHKAVKGFGELTLTAILHVSQPQKYGVYNTTARNVMMKLNIFPSHRGETTGSHYLKYNAILRSIADGLGTDLWTLDALWYVVPSIRPAAEDDSDPAGRAAEEGRLLLSIHYRRERDAHLVAAKKRVAATLACECCEFDFGKTYGELGAGFIECHHRRPLAALRGSETANTTLDDLALVCANCHCVIHRSVHPLEVEALRALLRTRTCSNAIDASRHIESSAGSSTDSV